MTKYATLALMALAGSLVGGGCSTVIDEGPERAVRVASARTDVQYNNVVFLDAGLQRRIEVQRSSAERTPTDTVGVYVVFRNRTDYAQQLECRVQFFDGASSPVGSPSAWQRVFFEPNAIVPWRESSLSEAAQFYYVEVREAR